MKRYLVFAGYNYYPSGGWNDFKHSFDTLKECKDYLISNSADWCHIVDSETGTRVFDGFN